MRALSADERFALASMAGGAQGWGFVWDDHSPDAARWDDVHDSLVARECCDVRSEVDEDGDEGETYSITDLGRLALRVAVEVRP